MMACFSVRELRYLWTWAWLTPYRANIRKTPPTPNVQKVWRSRGSGFRLHRKDDVRKMNPKEVHKHVKIKLTPYCLLTPVQQYGFHWSLSSTPLPCPLPDWPPPQWPPAGLQTSPPSGTRRSRSLPSDHPDAQEQRIQLQLNTVQNEKWFVKVHMDNNK